MTTPPTTAGLRAELRDLPVGGVLSRAARVPIADRAELFAWRKGVTPLVAQAPGTYSMQTLDAVEGFEYAIRVIVIVRTS